MRVLRKNNVQKIVLALPVLALLAACTESFRYHGYTPTPGDLEQLVVGVDTRGTVADVIGEPQSAGVLADSGWYYISSKVRHYAYKEPQVTERELVALTFDDEDVLENVERFTLADGRVIPISRRVTDLPVKGPGFWRQLLGNIGNINAGQLIDN